ncbi:MAG: type 1 glutamine amidotransferase domain-containing protein [Bradymonadia bacterium]
MRPTRLTPKLLVSTTSWVVLLVCLLWAGSGCAPNAAYRVDVPQSDQAKVRRRPAGEVLMVLSAAPIQTLADGTTRETGYFLNEFYEPYQALVGAGYSITIATLDGQPPSLDPESLQEKYWNEGPETLAQARALVETLPQMRSPVPLAEAARRADAFQALVVPGGQGVMVDLLDAPTLHALIRDFAATDRPIGLICHAPAILSRVNNLPASFTNRHVTSVSGIEEWYIESFVMDAEAQVRGIGDRLETAGFRHESGFPGKSHAVRDCNLVTDQNPFSGEAFNTLFLDALRDWRRGGRCVPNVDG